MSRRRGLGGGVVFVGLLLLSCASANERELIPPVEAESLAGQGASAASAGAPGTSGAAPAGGTAPVPVGGAPAGQAGAQDTEEGGATAAGSGNVGGAAAEDASGGVGGAAAAGGAQALPSGAAPPRANGGATGESAPASPAGSGRSAGCGVSKTGSGTFVERALNVQGRDRTYHVMVPKTYDGGRAYPLVFRFHGTGGDGTSGGLGIEFASREDAIVVGPDGLDERWSNQNQANDLAFFDGMLDTLASEYCIDDGRVFAYGFSAGGAFTNLLGCERANVIRATAAIASYDRGESCVGGVAAWFHHDPSDDSVAIERGRTARDKVLERDGCSAETVPEGERCVRYRGCNPETPVVWCESSGRGHNIAADFAPNAVWRFFTSL